MKLAWRHGYFWVLLYSICFGGILSFGAVLFSYAFSLGIIGKIAFLFVAFIIGFFDVCLMFNYFYWLIKERKRYKSGKI